MNKSPKAYRSPDDEPLFENPTGDPAIVPDRVSPAVEGYFRIPAVWIGKEPDPKSVSVLDPNIHHAIVLKQTLRCGIEVWVQFDGTFLFDLSSWPLAPQITVPGYRNPGPGIPYTMPKETFDAERKAEDIAVFRAQLMNVHQACLIASERTLKGSSGAMPLPVTSWNTHKAITLAASPSYSDDTEDVRALARNVINNKDGVYRTEPLTRHVLSLDVVEHSFKILDKILSQRDESLVRLIEMAYIAGYRKVEKRFGETVVLAWAVCEQILSEAWRDLLADVKLDGRMTRTRRKKLEGRDYSISVVMEVLELHHRLDHKLYRLLEEARKSRNKWAHEMRLPNENEAEAAMRAVEGLMAKFKDLLLTLNSGGRGGVPQWNIWVWRSLGGGC